LRTSVFTALKPFFISVLCVLKPLLISVFTSSKPCLFSVLERFMYFSPVPKPSAISSVGSPYFMVKNSNFLVGLVVLTFIW